VLGTDDAFDNSLDNAKQCQIFATAGGFYEIKNNIEITFRVANELCDQLSNVTAMPASYYSLSENSKMVITKDSKFLGGVVVQLTDAFFADPLSLTTNYVIPLLITDVKGADGILTGTPADGVTNPNRFNRDDWVSTAPPRDYILYAVKFINPYDAIYLRRGTDNITENGATETVRRQAEYSPEEDEVMEGANRVRSISLTELEFPVNNHRLNNVNLNMSFKLNFTADGKCTFEDGAWKDGDVVKEYTGANFRVFNINVTGSGEYVVKGEKNSWGNKDRDVLRLNYTAEYQVELPLGSAPQTVIYETSDVLVFRNRGIAGPETFSPVLIP